MLGIEKLLEKIFGTASSRAAKKLWPVVEQVNAWADEYQSLSDEQLRAKTAEFRARIDEAAQAVREEIEKNLEILRTSQEPEEHTAAQTRLEELRKEELRIEHEMLDLILPEAFGAVKEACRRLMGTEYVVSGHTMKWNMIPYDVQILGGIVLHQGKISEMATGEGKTLVATMPLYLNALTGKGAHLVTVNDYLAKRDSEWMGIIYEFLGLTVGCIDDTLEPHSEERRVQYLKDISYGTNNQFGFDYLRDNMVPRADYRVQRGFYYAIVDEVDSVLIDEARTPLIISGPVETSIDERYRQWVSAVDNLVRQQRNMSNTLLAKATKDLEEGREQEAGEALLMVQRSTPKNPRFMKMIKEPGTQRIMSAVEAMHLREKTMHELDDKLYFAKDERESSINLSEKGQHILAPNNPELFTIPDLGWELDQIDRKEGLTEDQKNEEKRKLYAVFAERTEINHAVSQLLKAYTLFEIDVDYVVKDGKVMIVDEFTGRLMAGRRFSDGLHQALEAKERVTVEKDTQTFATITLQNFFRLYGKLAGMTGTASTESEEFWQIYKLEVISIPTNKPVCRKDHDDEVYMTRREKYNAIIREVEEMIKAGRPVLVGTVSVEVSETLSRMLRNKNISHSVLNAKYHEKEAEIVADAGRAGVVTIATNMAGRGTDIKLGAGVTEAGGLHIIGSERHESRRIDNQLRGRAGRQGDPGSSRFYVSLEDDLMRLYAGGEKIASLMEKVGSPKDEALVHPMVTSSIERAQKRVEMQNFSIRKHLIEYDDVMNKQRTVIYAMRNDILDSGNLFPKYREFIADVTEMLVESYIDEKKPADEWDTDGLMNEFMRIYLVRLNLGDDTEQGNEIREIIDKAALDAFELKQRIIGPDITRGLMNWALLTTIDNSWKEHLQVMDTLQEGINLRAYAQKDPLIEYKREGYETFAEMLDEVKKEALIRFFHTQVQMPTKPQVSRQQLHTKHEAVGSFSAPSQEQKRRAAAAAAERGEEAPDGMDDDEAPQKGVTIRKDAPKVGRNDPCPCGSGKKYKHCCGKL